MPDSHRSIMKCSRQKLSIRRKPDLIDGCRKVFKSEQFLARFDMPQMDCVIVTGHSNRQAVGGDINSSNIGTRLTAIKPASMRLRPNLQSSEVAALASVQHIHVKRSIFYALC